MIALIQRQDGLDQFAAGKTREVARQLRQTELAIDEHAIFLLVAAQQIDIGREVANREIEGADHVEILAAEHSTIRPKRCDASPTGCALAPNDCAIPSRAAFGSATRISS